MKLTWVPVPQNPISLVAVVVGLFTIVNLASNQLWPQSGEPGGRLVLALSAQTFPLAAVAQTPLADSFNPGVDGRVYSLAVQADGKILVGGQFNMLGGQSRNNLGRLNSDGTLDTSFNPRAWLSYESMSYSVNSLLLQPDGKILVGGGLTMRDGSNRSDIGRLNPDGTLDTTFNPGEGGIGHSWALQADGKILVGSETGIDRLNSDGTADPSFNPGIVDGVFSLGLQEDGKILVAAGVPGPSYIIRLNSDGTVDTSFNPDLAADYLDLYSYLAVQPDGKILVFSEGWLDTSSSISRRNKDGSVDDSFNPHLSNDMSLPKVYCMAVQTDGKILVGGWFDKLDEQRRNSIGRLNAGGTLDTAFDPGTDDVVSSLAVQADGKILVGGVFRTLGGQSRRGIGQLNNTGSATQSLTFDGSTLVWQRGGTSPEVLRTTFEYTSDGASWTNLGSGIRIPGGWQLSGLTLPTNTTFRARGYIVGGSRNGSSWFVETVLRPALSISNLSSAKGRFGFTLTGPARRLVVVEASADLVTWLPLLTNIASSQVFRFDESVPATLPFRYFRAVGPEP